MTMYDQLSARIKANLGATYDLCRDVCRRPSFTIKNVIHNDPATIVFWADGTKTVVKAQPGDIYDPEKGLAMAISKKALGNRGNYCNVFHKWLPKEKTEKKPKSERKWKIWWKEFDNDGKQVGSACSIIEYACKSSATRRARMMFAPKNVPQGHIEWIVSQTNPWGKG